MLVGSSAVAKTRPLWVGILQTAIRISSWPAPFSGIPFRMAALWRRFVEVALDVRDMMFTGRVMYKHPRVASSCILAILHSCSRDIAGYCHCECSPVKCPLVMLSVTGVRTTASSDSPYTLCFCWRWPASYISCQTLAISLFSQLHSQGRVLHGIRSSCNEHDGKDTKTINHRHGSDSVQLLGGMPCDL